MQDLNFFGLLLSVPFLDYLQIKTAGGYDNPPIPK